MSSGQGGCWVASGEGGDRQQLAGAEMGGQEDGRAGTGQADSGRRGIGEALGSYGEMN